MSLKLNILILGLLFILTSFLAVDVYSSSLIVVNAERRLDGGALIADSIVVFDGSGVKELHYNKQGFIRLGWSYASGVDIHINSGAGVIINSLDQPAISNSIELRVGDIGGLADGTYVITLRERVGGAVVSHPVNLVIDTLPPAAPSSIAFLDLNGNAIPDTFNLRAFRLQWPEPEGADASRYEIRQTIGTTVSTFQSTTKLFNVELSSNLANNTNVTFQVFSFDKAGNISATAASRTYTLRFLAPNPPTGLVLTNQGGFTITGDSGGNFNKISFTASTSSALGLTYEVSVNNTVIQSGSSAVEYINIFTGLNFTSNQAITIRVVAIDAANNRSTAIERVLRYDATPPVFDIRYLNRNLNPASSVTASGVTINSRDRATFEVVNVASDITSYEILRGSESIVKEDGNASSLEARLRSLTLNGLHTVTVFDAAMNASNFIFNLRVEAPSLPPNRTLTVNGTDQNLGPGVTLGPGESTRLRVEFDASSAVNNITGSGSYLLLINGRPVIEPVNPVPLSNGRIRLDYSLRTALFGDLEYIYEVQVIDEFGNVGRYNLQTNVVIRDVVIPYARIVSTQSTDTSITTVIDLVDPTRVLSSAGAKAELYNGAVLVATVPLTPGVQTYTFPGLRDRQVNYNFRIVGTYTLQGASTVVDAVLNGASNGNKYLIDTLRANSDVTGSIKNIRATATSVVFDVDTIKSVNQQRFVDVFLFQGVGPYTGNPVKSERIDLTQADTASTKEISFTGLSSGVNYHIQIREGGYVLSTSRFITNLPLPNTSYQVVSVQQDQATVNITLNEVPNAVAYVFQGNNLVSDDPINLISGGNRRTINGLDPNTTYTVKVLAEYTRFQEVSDDGSVLPVQVNGDLIGEYQFTTAKRLPTASIPPVLIDVVDSEVLFSVLLEDRDNSIIRASIVLYESDRIVDEIAIDPGRSNLKFSNLKSNTDYILSIHVTYDLQDGRGEISRFGRLNPSALTTSFVVEPFKTIKAIPSLTIIDVVRTNQSISLVIQPSDIDDAFVAGSIRIFGDQPAPIRTEILVRSSFQREVQQSITFTGLQADTPYRIEVELDYNLLDGMNVRTFKPLTQTYRTRPAISLDVMGVRSRTNSIEVDLQLFDFTAQSVLARLFSGDQQVGSALSVSNDLSTVAFENLESNRTYRVVIDYNNGSTILATREVRTQTSVTLAAPSGTSLQPTVDNQRATIRIAVVDPDQTLGNVATIEICDLDSDACLSELRTIQQVIQGTEVALPYANQSVTVKIDYDLQTTTDTLEILVASNLLSTPSTDPVPEPIVEPTVPREPLDINVGVVFVSVVGAIAVGFVGIFFYSFRRFYTG